MYDIIIVGCGPAGMTAALYALRANKKVLLFEASSYGGQIINSNMIENYPGISNISGYDFATNLYNQIVSLGAIVKYETVTGIKKNKVFTNDNVYGAKAIIIATGAQSRKLNINNEDRLIGKGISYCATCDGNFYKGKVVAIVGGGNTALEDAIYLSGIVNKVYLIHRNDSFSGEKKHIDEISNLKNVDCIMNSRILKINGSERLESIEIVNSSGDSSLLKVDGLFIAIGQMPNNQIFSNTVDIDKFGYIISSDGVHTSCDGIYVAGDAREKDLRQLTTAVSDGSVAATVAIKEMR